MSIVIDTDLTYLVNRLNISETKIQDQYTDMSAEEIIKAEASQGNQAAIQLAQELLNNPQLVIELFKLADPNNKYMILSEMTAQQLKIFLPQMEEKDLNYGLNFFTQDKLMKLLEQLPPEQLVNTVFEMFSQEDIVKLMPDDQLNKFLTSSDIDKNKILKHLQSIPPEYLAQMIEGITGDEVQNMDSIDMTKQIGQLNPLEFKDALTNMQPTPKQQLVLSLGKEHEEWFQLFDAHAYTNIINTQKEKPEVVKAMNVIEPEYVIKMLEELPNDLLSFVITQMDTEKFTEILMDRFPEVLAEIIMK
ncbi:MAG: hypothetical protein ACLSWI_02700 [Candidatus Gastranaerophilaceae bacterium]